MVTFLAVGVCLLFLLVSTFVWALQHVRLTSDGAGEVPAGLLKAHIWAVTVPLLLVLVLISASIIALLSSNASGFERLVSALGSTVVRMGLSLCALPTGVAAVLCVRGWRSQDWSKAQKLHYSAFVLVLFVTLFGLFVLGAG